MTTANKIKIASIAILIAIISLWYGQNHGLLPVAASPEAEAVDGIFQLMMTVATALFLLIEGVLGNTDKTIIPASQIQNIKPNILRLRL